MPEPTVTKAEEGKAVEPIPSLSVPEVAVSGSDQPAEPVETLKTTELLKRWPAVLMAIQKSQDAYSSIKKRAGIINWSLNLTEKALGSVFTFVENKAIGLPTIIRYADKVVSGGVQVIEKKFPAVTESPEKLYEVVTQRVMKIVRPTLDETKAISELGRKKLNIVAKKIVKKYHGFIKRVDSWMDTLEKKLNGVEQAAVPGTESAAESASLSAAETPSPSEKSGRLRQAVQLGAQAATAVAAFQVGAAFWLLGRAPLVGRFFREAPVTRSSPSPTPAPSSADVSSSSSSAGLSLAAAVAEVAAAAAAATTAEPPASRPGSAHSLRPENSQQ